MVSNLLVLRSSYPARVYKQSTPPHPECGLVWLRLADPENRSSTSFSPSLFNSQSVPTDHHESLRSTGCVARTPPGLVGFGPRRPSLCPRRQCHHRRPHCMLLRSSPYLASVTDSSTTGCDIMGAYDSNGLCLRYHLPLGYGSWGMYPFPRVSQWMSN